MSAEPQPGAKPAAGPGCHTCARQGRPTRLVVKGVSDRGGMRVEALHCPACRCDWRRIWVGPGE